MEISVHDVSEIEKEISVLATPGDLEPHFEKAYKRYQSSIEIKGFRKGKVPLDLVRKIHGESIEYRALDDIANDVYREIMQERNLHPVGDPVLTDMDYKRGEAFSFKIKFEVMPDVQPGRYTDLSVERPLHITNDPEVDDEILRIRKSSSVMSEVPSVTDDEHVVTADVQQLDPAGTPLIGKKETGVRMYLAGGTMYEEIKQALRSSGTGETKRVQFEVDRDGQKSMNHLELTVRKIEKVLIPDLDDAFVAKITKDKVKTVDEFRSRVRQDIESYWHEASDRQVDNSLVAQIVHAQDFPVPESMVRGILDSLVEDVKSRSPNKKLPPDFKEEEFRSSNRALGVFQAKWYLIREQIIRKEDLKVEDADFDRIADQESAKTGIDRERLKAYYASSASVKDKILSEKLMKFLHDHSKITEKVIEEHAEENESTLVRKVTTT